MIRGAQKRMIVLKTEGSKLFEEAYFILRREAPKASCANKKALVGEAEKILSESAPGVRPKRFFSAWIFFLLGILFGVLAFCMALLLKKALL